MKPAINMDALATLTPNPSATIGNNGSSSRILEPDAKPASASNPIGTGLTGGVIGGCLKDRRP
jgi:hypothetical protein